MKGVVMTICRICGNEAKNKSYSVREMMFGMGEEFDYFQCAQCGCLQIAEVPNDLSKYYPSNYYSYQRPAGIRYGRPMHDNVLTRILQERKDEYSLHGGNMVGWLLVKLLGEPHYFEWLRHAGISKGDAILDVGCGSGSLLVSMGNHGFENLTGIDPFIEDDICYENGVTILRKDIIELSGSYDLIMLHHSFEHMANPRQVMQAIQGLLAPNGTALIRIPTVSGWAWKHYGTNWVQLDAPRHLYLHSLDSIKRLAVAEGLEIVDVVYDSGEVQFWGSEQYLRGIHYCDSNSYRVNPRGAIFSKKQLREFRRRAIELNERGEGDSACFYLRATVQEKCK